MSWNLFISGQASSPFNSDRLVTVAGSSNMACSMACSSASFFSLNAICHPLSTSHGNRSQFWVFENPPLFRFRFQGLLNGISYLLIFSHVHSLKLHFLILHSLNFLLAQEYFVCTSFSKKLQKSFKISIIVIIYYFSVGVLFFVWQFILQATIWRIFYFTFL